MFSFLTSQCDRLWEWFSHILHSSVNPNVVLTLALAFMIYYFFRSRHRFLKKIMPVATDLKEANAALDFEENEKDHVQYFYKNYKKISDRIEAIPTLSHHWQEFKEHVIFPTETESTEQKLEQLKIRNSLPPSFFFSEEKFIERPIDLRYIDAVPGKLVALGVLFTFVGLSIGIASATHTLGGLEGALDTPELNKTLMMLLKGASLAFITSVAGIALSLCFSRIEKRKIKDVKKSLNSFVDKLEKSLSFITSEQIHLQIRDIAKEQNKKLDGFSNELAIALSNAISAPLKENFDKMANAIIELKNTQQNFSENLMQTLVDKMSGDISSQVQQNQQQAAEAFTGVQQAFAQQAEAMFNSQNTMVASSHDKINQLMASFEKLLVTSNDNIDKNIHMQAAYGDIAERQQDVVAKFSAISQAVENTNAHMSEASQENKAAASLFRESAESLSAMWPSYDQKFKETDEVMSKNFKHFENYTNQFHTLLSKYVSDLTKEFEKALTLLAEDTEDTEELKIAITLLTEELKKAITLLAKGR